MDAILVKLLEEYEKRFGDSYPLMEVTETQDESIKHIRKCLKDNKPLEIDYDGKIF